MNLVERAETASYVVAGGLDGDKLLTATSVTFTDLCEVNVLQLSSTDAEAGVAAVPCGCLIESGKMGSDDEVASSST